MKKASISISPLLLFKNVMDIFSAVHQEHKCDEVFVDIKITDAVRSEAAQREAPETETITQCKSPLNALHFPFRPDECLKA